MPELIELAGGEPVLAKAGQPAPPLAAPEAVAPEVVVVKPCGFSLERTAGEAEAVRRLSPASWPAAGRRRVYLADGSALFNRPGPRLVDSLELLAGRSHPRACGDLPARQADAWRALA